MIRVNQIIGGAFTQLGRLWKILLFLYVSILALFIILDLVSRFHPNFTLSYFTRDITAIGHLPFFAGLVSQLGGLLWSAALAICLFTYVLLNQRGPETRSARRFLLQAALLTGILLLDDYFQLHEDIGPNYLGISQKLVILFYGIFALFFLFFNLNEILGSEYLLLGLALAMFGLSILIDGTHPEKIEPFKRIINNQLSTFIEDGFKFVGVATWLTYFARYSARQLNARLPGKDISITAE
jgi:hypothetical protein